MAYAFFTLLPDKEPINHRDLQEFTITIEDTQYIHRAGKQTSDEFEVYADGELIYRDTENYHSLIKVKIDRDVKKVSVKFNDTWGAEKVNIFACDFI